MFVNQELPRPIRLLGAGYICNDVHNLDKMVGSVGEGSEGVGRGEGVINFL